MKKCMHKIKNMPLQSSSIFSCLSQMSQCAFFPGKILCVSKARKCVRVKSSQMPGPRGSTNLQMPHSRDWQGGQMPRSSPGGGGGLGAAGIDWCINVRTGEKKRLRTTASILVPRDSLQIKPSGSGDENGTHPAWISSNKQVNNDKWTVFEPWTFL